MPRSEIFDNFIKIAKEKGLIYQDENSEHKAEHTEKDFHETNPRFDSLSIDQINKLYNLKLDKPKDMEYKYNIIEDAHPEPVVISPAYDKLNGLVENDNERQRIMMRITMKEADGHLIGRKYAKQKLLTSLVKVANYLDNKDQDSLRKLADTCLFQLNKKAFLNVAIPALVAALGVLYAKQHLPFHSDGWSADYDKAVNEIDDLLNSSQTLGVGYTYKPELMETLNQLKSVLTEMNQAVEDSVSFLQEVEAPRTGPGITEEMEKLSQDPNVQKAHDSLETLRNLMYKNGNFIGKVIVDFQNPTYKQNMTADKGTFTSWIDSAEILHGGKGLVADDFDDVAHALETLKNDLLNLVKTLKGISNVKAKFQEELEANQQEVNSEFVDDSVSSNENNSLE